MSNVNTREIRKRYGGGEKSGAKCRTCGAPIVWLRTRSGSYMPVDAQSVKGDEDLFDAKSHTSHFATCPDADKHRKNP